jgi:hypothetical protein
MSLDRTPAYADALRTFAHELTAVLAAASTVPAEQLERLLKPVATAGQATGLSCTSVAEQVRNTVLFLRGPGLSAAARQALADDAARRTHRWCARCVLDHILDQAPEPSS